MEYVPYVFLAAGILSAVIAWLGVTQRRLAALLSDVERANRQLTMHRALALQVRDGPDEVAAQNMLEISHTLYRASTQTYNQALHKPANRLPACILGYRLAAGEAER